MAALGPFLINPGSSRSTLAALAERERGV